jgi:S-DNA-T family DNA segregation ATPase FtsK/SpoIIIE
MYSSFGDLSVSVGQKEDGTPIEFLLDTVSHVHAFVLGQSGSGKSVFLHSVLIELVKKYHPSDLCLYLLDFKLGGVEFNRYRDIKHVKALLVDNSNIQITLEILRDLSNQMRERGKMLREAGVSNIKEYNQKYPNEHLPQILFVADE